MFLVVIVTVHLSSCEAGRTEILLHSREGLMQGYPLSMVAYDIRVLPLTKQLKAEYPDINQTWYAGDSNALGIFTSIEICFNFLKQFGPGHGYYTIPLKSVMIVSCYRHCSSLVL